MNHPQTLPPEEIKRRVIGIAYVMFGLIMLSGVVFFLRQFLKIHG